MAISLNMVAFIWFIYVNRCLSKNEIPKCLEKVGILVKKVLCLCFPLDKKESSKVSNADIPTIIVKNSAKPISIENSETIKPKPDESLEKAALTDITVTNKTDSVVLPKPVDGLEKMAFTDIPVLGSTDDSGLNSIEYSTEMSKMFHDEQNKIVLIPVKSDQQIVVVADGAKPDSTEKSGKESKTEEKKCKCKFCDRCSECEADFKKDKDKGKAKKDLELILQALNWLAFVIMFVCMIAGNLGVWLNLQK